MLVCRGTAGMPRRRLAFTANAGQPRATINAAWRCLLPGPVRAAVMTDRAVCSFRSLASGFVPADHCRRRLTLLPRGVSTGQDHSDGPGIIEANEQVTFPPLPCDRYPAPGHPLPDLPPHDRVPARQPHGGPDRALPPGPPRSTPPRIPVAGRGDPGTNPAVSDADVGRPTSDDFAAEVSWGIGSDDAA